MDRKKAWFPQWGASELAGKGNSIVRDAVMEEGYEEMGSWW